MAQTKGNENFKSRTIWENDNLAVMRGLNSGCVDLIYLDPPFNSNRAYASPIGDGKTLAGFNDTWVLSDQHNSWVDELLNLNAYFEDEHNIDSKKVYHVINGVEYIHSKPMKAYLIFMAVRLIEMKRILKDTGSIYLHCDPTASHYLKILMDAVFGRKNFRNEIVWHYRRWTSASKQFQKMHDVIFYYSKTSDYLFTKPLQDYADEKYIEDTVRGIVDGKIVRLKDEKGNYKRRQKENKGVLMHDVWQDINFIAPTAKERTGYPTQKPLKLLERIIKASSNEGDLVFDPFCGCATTCVQAEILDRRWIGIDIEKKTITLLKDRLKKEVFGTLITVEGKKMMGDIVHSTQIPERTDLEPAPKYKHRKQIKYGEQGGICRGCKLHFRIQNFEEDHIIPKEHGGQTTMNNLQLLCGHCNRVKGTKGMPYLLSKLKEDNIIQDV